MAQRVEQLYRPGLEGIIAGETDISAVKQDSLMYRGYAIEELAEHSPFEETAWLLLHGELPTKAQLAGFRASLDKYRALPKEVRSCRNSANCLRTSTMISANPFMPPPASCTWP